MRVVVRTPGRVNLIGDHTDYTGGLVLPMAIDRWTTLSATLDGADAPRVRLRSDDDPVPVDLPIVASVEPLSVEPVWGRYVAAVIERFHPSFGLDGSISTTIPVGAGLSSSAALEITVALALGHHGTPRELAEGCREAEHRATGVPTGIMDQLSIAAARPGAATLIDCHTLDVTPIAVPDGIDVVVQFVTHRTLVGSAYADRVDECRRAEAVVGPLRDASLADLTAIDDAVVRRRARHVVTENQRVTTMAEAFAARDLTAIGELLVAGHMSLRDDYDTSTPTMDAAVDALMSRPGVYGARMTGGGFGGCIVAICDQGALDDDVAGGRMWKVRPAGGPTVDVSE